MSDDFAEMDDCTLISMRQEMRAQLEQLPPHSADHGDLQAIYDQSTEVINERARAAWTAGRPAPVLPLEAKGNLLMTDTVSMRRRLVGSALRRYREDLGYDLAVPAQVLECDKSKISRIETGQRGIRPKELRELLTEYGADPDTRDTLTALATGTSYRAWRNGYDPIAGSAYAEFLEIEKTASAIFTYAPARIPRLLQTPAYARALMSADPNVPGHAQAALAAAEHARQQAALHQRRTPLAAVIGEAALRQHVGSPEVTGAQLRHLDQISGSCPQVCIRILPFAAGEHASSGAGFSVLRFTQVASFGLVHLDGPGEGVCTDTPAAVAACTTAFEHMQLFAITTEECAARLGMRPRVRRA